MKLYFNRVKNSVIMKNATSKSYSFLFSLLFLLTLFGSSSLFAQTITTGIVNPTVVCKGGLITVPFVTTGSFQEGKYFKVQLSTASGSFTSTTVIGSQEIENSCSSTNVVNRSITANIPSSISSGTAYRVRVVYTPSNNATPWLIGSINADKITIASSKLNPAFTLPTSICSGTALTLPTVSTNGVSGTWSPSFNNTVTTNTTTNYTFTPTTGFCSNSGTRTITVNANVTPSFNNVESICSGNTLNALPTQSLNNVIGNWSPVLNNTATTTYTFTPIPGVCALTKTMTVIVNPRAIPTFESFLPICSGENVSAFPQTSTNGIVGSWFPLTNNVETTTYTFTPNNDYCATTATGTLVVNPIVTIDTSVTACMSFYWPVNGQTYTSSGYYTFTTGCTIYNLNLNIKQPSALATPSLISGTAVGLCLNGITNPTFSVAPVLGASSYLWTVPTGATIVSGEGTVSVTLHISGEFTSGLLTVKAVDVCTTSVTRVMTIRSILATPGTITGSLTGLCEVGNNSPSYLAAAVAGATGYTWTSPTGTSIATGQGTNSILLNIGSSFTTGSLRVTADNACGSSIPRAVTISNVTLMPGAITGPSVGLGANGITTATYTTANVVGVSDYFWIVPTGTEIVSGQGTNSITLNFTSSFTSGGLSVEARNACGSSAKRILNLLSVPMVPGAITGVTTGLCSQGVSTATYSIATVNGATCYTWTAPAGTEILSGQGTTSIVLSFSSSFTTGSLRVSSNNLCGSSALRTLVLNSVPLTPGAVTGATNNLCLSGISNPTYSFAAVLGATSYTWSTPTGIAIGSGQGTTSVDLAVSESFVSGSLTLVANNACGSSLVRSVSLSSIPLTPASISGSTTPCGTETYTCATVAQAVSYAWTVPAGLEIISGQGTNTITVNVTSTTVSSSITVKASNNCKTGAARSLVVKSCTAKSMLTSMEEESSTIFKTSLIEAVVYPNPTNGEVNIEFTDELEKNVSIELYDMIGNKVSRSDIPAGSTVGNLTLEGMTSGMYLLHVVNSNNDIIYKSKVSKQ
jgi:hypothetical protein